MRASQPAGRSTRRPRPVTRATAGPYPRATATAAATTAAWPARPSSTPAAAPPVIDAARYAVTVTPHRLSRARSPSGWMLASIDSPHGDQLERSPATVATTRPAATADHQDTALFPLGRRAG